MINCRKQKSLKTVFFIFLLSCYVCQGYSQSSGEFQWLAHWTNIDAITIAKGKINLSSFNPSINDALQNPARLIDKLSYNTSFNYSPFFGVLQGVKFGYVYQDETTQWKNFGLELKFLDFGSLKAFDISGINQGSFPLKHFNLALGTGMPADKAGLFKLGLEINWLSSYWLYDSASAVSLSFGIFYRSPNQLINAGVLLSGLGFTLKNFQNNRKTIKIPVDLQIDMNIKLENAPLIIHLGFIHLTQLGNYIFSLNGLGKDVRENTTTLQKYLYHMVFGTDFVISKVVQFHLSYGFKEQTYRLDNLTGITGLSAGLSIKARRLALRYGKQFYGAFGSTNHITLELKLNKLWKIKK